jgi:Fe-S-cluster containining protein
MSSSGGTPELDVRLLRGFRFECRPDCGLCCYAEPRVSPTERERLVQIVPETEFVRHGEALFLAGRPDGGACQFLDRNRCAAHAARPHPCREFPVSVHVGARLQATVVLSCPGVELSALRSDRRDLADGEGGFSGELAAVRERLDPTVPRRMDAAQRRRRRIARTLESQGRWEEEESVRTALRTTSFLPTLEDFPAMEPPELDQGVERMPLFFDGRSAPVALSSGLGGWELHELSPTGGLGEPIAVIPPPDRPPVLSSDATELLVAYLRYWLERDAFFGALHLAMTDARDGSVSEWAHEELRSIGAVTVARAQIRAKLARAEAGRLTAPDIELGIRATDQDFLDRDSWGERL